MDNVPIVPAEDDMSYIPTIQHPSSNVEQSTLQVPTIRYTPATAQSPSSIPLLSSSRTILAADATPFIQGFQYRATLVQQVHFQYPTPPTPPVEGCNNQEVVDKDLHPPMENLAITHGGMDNESPKPVNPFPSLPTPPDVQDLQQDHQHQMHSGAMINPVAHPAIYSKQMPTRFRMPPFNENAPVGVPFKPPSLQQQMFCYTAPPHCDDPKKAMIPGLGSPRPPIPPLLKDGKLIL